MVIGMLVTGTGIPSNTHIKSITNNSYFVIDNTATTKATGTSLVLSYNSEIRYTTFEDSGTIEANGCSIENCVFSNLRTTTPISATYALIIDSTAEAARIKNCTFINCNRAVKLTVAGSYVFDNLKFYGNVYDIENSSSGDVTISAINGSNVSTYINTGGGSVSISNPITLTLSGLVEDSEVRIFSHGTTTELDGVENSDTTFQYNYNYAAGTYVDIVVHNVDYIYYRINNYLLQSSSTNLPIQQQFDRVYRNP